MKLKIKNDFMPSWEDVEVGYFSHKVQGRYLGEDEYGNPKCANTRRFELVAQHNISNVFKIFIQYDKKDKNPEFILKMFGWQTHFDYTKKGYQELIECMEHNLDYEINILCEVKE